MLVSTNLGRLLALSISLCWYGTAFSGSVSSSMLKIERFSAERGDAQSQYFMGEHYELGDSGLPRDLDAALKWYYMAADNGDAAAQYKIGLFHEKEYAGLPGGLSAAMQWYEKAAAGGNEAAKQRIASLRKPTTTEKTQPEAKQRNKMLQASKPAMAGLPLKLPQRRAPKYRPEETIENLVSALWVHAGQPAEYLPAEDMSCMKSSELELTCFSRTRIRSIGENRMEFTVKSILTGFRDDGSFNAKYYYNVAEIDNASESGPDVDTFGLLAEEGWQQPGYEVACHVSGKNGVICKRNSGSSVRFDRK